MSRAEPDLAVNSLHTANALPAASRPLHRAREARAGMARVETPASTSRRVNANEVLLAAPVGVMDQTPGGESVILPAMPKH